MASDETLFDSEELNVNNKENMSLNDMNTKSQSESTTENSNASKIEESSNANTIQETKQTKNNEVISHLESQSSQEILDNILGKNGPESQSSQEILDNILGKNGPESRSSQEILDNILGKNVQESQSSQEILDSIGKIQNSVENINEDSQSSQDILDNIGKNPKTVIKSRIEPNLMNSETLNTNSPDILETDTVTEPPESMELSEQTANTEELNNTNDDTQMEVSESIPSKASDNSSPAVLKNCMLPLSRVKLIMKTDPNIKIVSSEATILAAIAAEKFLKFVIEETYRVTQAHKKKTLQIQHFNEAIQGLEVTEFLEGMMEDEA